MCKVCDAKNALADVCEQLDMFGQSDLALKFQNYSEIVRSRTYDIENKERNSDLKVRMLDLARQFATGYMPVTKDKFHQRICQFNIGHKGAGEIRFGMKNAMIELFSIYGNRLPWALYGGYMFMVTRPNVHVAERLPELKHLLPADLPWECIDAVWHGFPPATALYIHILAVINRHTGTVPLHGCGCNHYLPPIKDPGTTIMQIVYPQPEDILAETEVPLSHCLTAIETFVLETFVLFGETTKSLQHVAVKAPRTGVHQDVVVT